MTSTKPAAAMISVYSGRSCRGFVLARGVSGFEGFDRDEKSLGLFPTEREAVAAILERWPAP
jgi:hypothetical protein